MRRALAESSRSEGIYQVLRERILNGELAQGERLVVRSLADEFKASDLPVREALRRLEGDGLIETVRNRGARVVTLGPEDIAGVYILRGELEALATELAGPKLSAKDFARLDSLMAEMAEVGASSAPGRYASLNHAFHSVIFERCPHPVILQTLNRLWDGHAAFGLVFSIDSERIARSRAEHAVIVEHLKAADWEKAGAVAREHKHATARSLLESVGVPIPAKLRPSMHIHSEEDRADALADA